MATSTSDITSQFTADKRAAATQAAKQDKANGTNPSAQLDKDAFMKLLLTELQHQDPTSPMDTEKMLTQTSQLATLEMQENTNSAMKELVNQLKTNSSMYALSALGKMANLGGDTITTTESDKSLSIPVYLPSDAKSGTMEILDSNNKVVKTLSLGAAPAGVSTAKWDLTDDSGAGMPAATYKIKVRYTDANNKTQSATYGTYPVESVKFVDGKAQVKIAGEYMSVDKVAEFYEG